MGKPLGYLTNQLGKHGVQHTKAQLATRGRVTKGANKKTRADLANEMCKSSGMGEQEIDPTSISYDDTSTHADWRWRHMI